MSLSVPSLRIRTRLVGMITPQLTAPASKPKIPASSMPGAYANSPERRECNLRAGYRLPGVPGLLGKAHPEHAERDAARDPAREAIGHAIESDVDERVRDACGDEGPSQHELPAVDLVRDEHQDAQRV